MARMISPYFGGKQKQAEWIISHLPHTEGYCEPFGGMLSVFLNKPLSKRNVVNDKDERIFCVYKALRECPEELIRALALTPHSRKEYRDCLEDDMNQPLVERARRTLVVLSQSIVCGLGSGERQWRTIINQNGGRLRTGSYWEEKLIHVLDRMQYAQIECCDGIDLLKKYSKYQEWLIYLDPPYHFDSRSCSSDRYGKELDAEQHNRLLDICVKSKAKIVLSGFSVPAYEDKLSDWNRYEERYFSRVGMKKGVSSEMDEVLWTNFSRKQKSLLE